MQNKNEYSIIVAGDLMPSEENFGLFVAGNVEKLFGQELIQFFSNADYSIVNLEGALTDSTICQEKEGPVIKAPVNTVLGIKSLGVKALALANNHITDYLDRGYHDTTNALDSLGIDYVGTGDNAQTIKKYLSFSLGNKKVCIYNVSETFFNRPSKDTAGVNVYDEWIVCNEIKELKKSHDFLIVIYHGGAEYFPYPTPQTRTRFHRMADCGADFITAQHTHCIGCEEYYNGSYLLYGQGNFLFARQKGLMMRQGLLSEIVLNDNGFSVNNILVIVDNGVVRFDAKQDLTDFYERSKRVEDTDYIVSLFKSTKSKEIMDKYLRSYKGGFPLRKMIMRFVPRYKKELGKTYSKQQMLRNLNVVQGERRCEDMYYVWQYIIEEYGRRKTDSNNRKT